MIALSMALSVGACTTGSSAVADAFRYIGSRNAGVESAMLRTDVRYLRLTTHGRVVLLALGYVEPAPDGQTEIWYSGTGEVLKLRDGRIVGTTGLATDWRSVRLTALPRWADVSQKPVEYRREIDEMPGYRYDLSETVALRATAPPRRTSLVGIDADTLQWFEERVVSGPKDHVDLPAARIAVAMGADQGSAIYGEQCLAADLCLAWQQWPPQASAESQAGGK